MDNSDVEKLNTAIELVQSVRDKVDCHYCQSHVDIAIGLLRDIRDITEFNTLYKDDKEALDRLRALIQSENMLRILAMGSRLVGISRKIHIRIGKPKRD